MDGHQMMAKAHMFKTDYISWGKNLTIQEHQM